MTVQLDAKMCRGGLVTIAPALSADPGSAAELLNFETDVSGSFRRMDGYERFDGQTPPSSGWTSDWEWDYGPDGGTSPDGYKWEGTEPVVGELNESVTLTIPLNGLSLVGGVKMAPGGEFAILTHELNTAHYTGQVYNSQQEFLDAIIAMPNIEDAYVDEGSLVVVSTVPMIPGIYPRLELLHWVVLDDSNSEDTLRGQITGPAGYGPIMGLAVFKGIVICARDTDETGTSSALWRSTPNGWEQIPMPAEVVQTGTVTGATDTTVTVAGAGWTENEWQGYSVQVSSGAGEGQVRIVASNTEDTLTISEAWTTQPDGEIAIFQGKVRKGGAKYNFIKYNFTGDPKLEGLYGADGKNKAFEIKGDPYPGLMEYTEIDTVVERGLLTYYPQRVAAHAMHLFLSFEGGWLQYSGIGNPFSDDVNDGAGGIAYYGDITNLLSLRDNSMAITTRDQIYLLYGTSELDWQNTAISVQGDATGALPDTAVIGTGTFMADHAGIFRMEAVQTFGNFATSMLSLPIYSLYRALHPATAGAVAIRDRSMYRIYYHGGEFITMTVGPESILGFGYGKLNFSPHVVASGMFGPQINELEEAVFVGGDDGMVYRMDRGDTFDGDDIPAAIRFHFHNGKNPRQVKRWRKAVFEIKTPSIFEMKSNAIFDYGGTEEAALHQIDLANLTQSGGVWNVNNWSEFYWHGKFVGEGEMRIDGHARSASLMLFCEGRIPSFMIEAYTVHFSPRRLAR